MEHGKQQQQQGDGDGEEGNELEPQNTQVQIKPITSTKTPFQPKYLIVKAAMVSYICL